MTDTHLIIDELDHQVTSDPNFKSPKVKVMRHASTRLTDLTTWKPIGTMIEGLRAKPVIVGYNHMGVWVIRSAVWSDGTDWEAGGFENLEAATGWWSVETSVVQDKIIPTHYLMPTPDV